MAPQWTVALVLLAFLVATACASGEVARNPSGKELRTLLRQRGLQCPGCVDKADVVAVLRQHSAAIAADLTPVATDGDQQLLSDFKVAPAPTHQVNLPDDIPVLCEERINGTICLVFTHKVAIQ